MRNQIEIQERFLKEDGKMRLGHLASDLSRIASFIEMQLDTNVVCDVIEEAKLFAEWTAQGREFEMQTFLAEIQSTLAQRELELSSLLRDPGRKIEFIRFLKTSSSHLLKKAGFLEN